MNIPPDAPRPRTRRRRPHARQAARDRTRARRPETARARPALPLSTARAWWVWPCARSFATGVASVEDESLMGYQLVSQIDYATGFLGAYGVILALIDRQLAA